jgi:hypothetical protein
MAKNGQKPVSRVRLTTRTDDGKLETKIVHCGDLSTLLQDLGPRFVKAKVLSYLPAPAGRN